MLFGSLAAELTRGGEFDVLVLRGEETRSGCRGRLPPAGGADWRAYAGMLAVVAGCSVAATLMHDRFDPSNIAMVYLVGVVLSAVAFGLGPPSPRPSSASRSSISASSRRAFTFRVSDTQYLVTFAVSS